MLFNWSNSNVSLVNDDSIDPIKNSMECNTRSDTLPTAVSIESSLSWRMAVCQSDQPSNCRQNPMQHLVIDIRRYDFIRPELSFQLRRG